jgi:glyoxylase-like metal-dependent hydrolase (beta-lactamase superfamily II)
MQIKIFPFNPLEVNTYVLSDETKECAIIDAACYQPHETELLINYIVDNGFTVKQLINTHLHFDHIFGINALAEKFDVKVAFHKEDEFLLDSIPQKLAMFGFPIDNNVNYTPEVGRYLIDKEVIAFGNQQLKAIHVPGHSPGSLCYYNEAANAVFTGDVLFLESIGRTDLPGGDYDKLVHGIRTKLFTLPPETVVYPGHGPKTTIGFESEHNPFI